jgi:UDP-N-acetyl-D-mannosaminuronate dehydrogenase
MNSPLRLTVLGTGYLGSTHAACMASLAFDVLGVDTDAEKIDQLNAGHLPIYEPDLSQVHGCVATLAPLLDRPCLVVGKFTVPGWNYRALGVALTPPPSTPFAGRRSAKGGGQGASR